MLFKKLPFDKIVVHVSWPQDGQVQKEELEAFFSNYGEVDFLYSKNTGKGEVDAIRQFVATQDVDEFDILTYMHCKGVTKPQSRYITEWVKLMRYFIIEKMDCCIKVFQKGYVTFGINKTVPNQNDEGFKGSNFFYEGNFVSLNLNKVDLKKAVDTKIEYSYYGLEGFWGKLCGSGLAYSIFDSGVNHYMAAVSQKDYTTRVGRLKYGMVRKFYRLKAFLKNLGTPHRHGTA